MEDNIIDVSPTTNDVPSALKAYQIIDALVDDDVAYRVYLALACRFGAGQAI